MKHDGLLSLMNYAYFLFGKQIAVLPLTFILQFSLGLQFNL
jgi:hypothetical protein